MEVSPERLRRFFTKEDPHYRRPERACGIVPASSPRQNVTVDSPFSRVDLVTRRNVLIYMSARFCRNGWCPLFHFALNPGGGGFLVLGLSEHSLGRSTTCLISSRIAPRIFYRKKRNVGPAAAEFAAS